MTKAINGACPLFCPKCKHENLINVSNLQVTVITESDAKLQSR